MEKVLLGQKVVHLEEMVKEYKEQVDNLAQEVDKVWFKINLMVDWISNRFGVELIEQIPFNVTNLETFPDSNILDKSQILETDISNKSNSNRNKKPIKSPLKFKQRSLKLDNRSKMGFFIAEKKRQVRRRKLSRTTDLKSDKNMQRSLPIEETHPEMQSNIILETKSFVRNLSEENVPFKADDTKLREQNSVALPKQISVDDSTAIAEKREDVCLASIKEQRRGRPKKRPEEKVENWKKRTPMVCDECGKVLKGAGSLKSHKLIHSNIRPHECKECGKAFRMKHHLDFHLLIHEGSKKWTCRFCNKGFIAQRDLLRHERSHTGERPHTCPYPDCTKSFNVKQHLVLHIRKHTGEKPYMCKVCLKTFSQANSLRIHKKIHIS